MRIRPARPDDEPLAVALHVNPDVRKFLWTLPHMDFTTARQWFNDFVMASEPPGQWFQAIEDDDGKVIGFIWYTNFDGHNAYISVGLVRRRGIGNGRKATALGLEYAFDALGCGRVSTTVVAGNEGGMKLAEFYSTLEGTMRGAFVGKDGVHDVFMYGLLESEWRAKRDSLLPAVQGA